jgi:hypothetical protein
MGSFFINFLAQSFYLGTHAQKKIGFLGEEFGERILPHHFLDVDQPKQAASQDPGKVQP